MKIATKRTFDNWVDMGDGVKFFLDYPSLEQEEQLKSIAIDIAAYQSKLDEKLSAKEESELASAIMQKMLEYQRLYIKFTVKDWKGLDAKFEKRNNALTDELVVALTNDIAQLKAIYSVIEKELEFNEADKKK